MTEDGHFKWSSEPLCICLYLGLNPRPQCSWGSVLPTSSQWQMLTLASHLSKERVTLNALWPPDFRPNFLKRDTGALLHSAPLYSPLSWWRSNSINMEESSGTDNLDTKMFPFKVPKKKSNSSFAVYVRDCVRTVLRCILSTVLSWCANDDWCKRAKQSVAKPNSNGKFPGFLW